MRFKDYKPVLMIIMVQFLLAGNTLFSRAALVEEMSASVFVLYKEIIAFLALATLAFFSRRETRNCRLDFKSFMLIFLLAFIGITLNFNMLYQGLYLSSSSVASAMGNLTPVITFIMAYFIGLEKVQIKSSRSIAKIIGTIICVSGAILMAIFKGPKLLNKEFLLRNLLLGKGDGSNWLLGCLLLFGSDFFCFTLANLAASGTCPDHVSLTAWMCLIGAAQCAVVAIFMETDMKAWRMKSYLQLFSCLFSGSSSAVNLFALAWCTSERGPLFSAMFNPLCTVIVTISSFIFFHEELYTGSLLGAVAVITGLYAVLWGKAKDEEQDKPLDGSNIDFEEASDPMGSSNDSLNCNIDLQEPLLLNYQPK